MTRRPKESAITNFYRLIAIAATRGYKIIPGNFHSDAQVCLCGAVLRAVGAKVPEADYGCNDGVAIIKKVARTLGITVAQAASLNNGFEGAAFTSHYVLGASELTTPKFDRTWYTIGKSLRRQYQKNNPT